MGSRPMALIAFVCLVLSWSGAHATVPTTHDVTALEVRADDRIVKALEAWLKLYRDGTTYDLVADPFEEKPLRVAALPAERTAEARRLQAVLDQYAKARPEHLANHKAAPVKD